MLAIRAYVQYAAHMKERLAKSDVRRSWRDRARAVYATLGPRAYSVILFGALFCNLAVKLFHAAWSGLLREYPSWICTDIAVLLTIEAAVALVCYRWPKRGVVRGATIFAAIVCTWSVMNAGWLIRTGTQILPMELTSLIRDPINITKMVVLNLVSMPYVAAALLIPSAIALAFFFSIVARPMLPKYDAKRFRMRIAGSFCVAVLALIGHTAVSSLGSAQIAAAGLRFNCQSRAVLAFVLPEYRHLARNDFSMATRELPTHESIEVRLKPRWVNHNVILVVLEGVQYDCTSLAAEGGVAPQMADREGGATPYLATLAGQGASFTNARSVVTHTTKALFALLTGRAPSASQDIAETVPMEQPYASLATILEEGFGFRTAFFQSATGTFESRPGLIHNLGFDTFWAREDLHDPNQFVGYLGSDEFAMLEPIREWIDSEDKPFLLTVLCSVTHDPYDLPDWYGPKAEEIVDRYQDAIAYTDGFIAALDVQLNELGLTNDTVFCVVGDHGEAFGEHRMMGHERIAYDEVLRIAMCMRAPFLIEPGTRITQPVSSVDLTPTILDLLGCDISAIDFDGANALEALPEGRRVYFSGWMQQGPAGFVQGDRKFVYDPEHTRVALYRLGADPLELSGLELPEGEAQRLSEEIVTWRRNTIFHLNEDSSGQTILFDSWLCKWDGRVSAVKHAKGK